MTQWQHAESAKRFHPFHYRKIVRCVRDFICCNDYWSGQCWSVLSGVTGWSLCIVTDVRCDGEHSHVTPICPRPTLRTPHNNILKRQQPPGTSHTEYCPPSSRNILHRIFSTKLTPPTYLFKRFLRAIQGYLKGSATNFPRWLWGESFVWKSQTFFLFLNKVLHKNLKQGHRRLV